MVGYKLPYPKTFQKTFIDIISCRLPVSSFFWCISTKNSHLCYRWVQWYYDALALELKFKNLKEYKKAKDEFLDDLQVLKFALKIKQNLRSCENGKYRRNKSKCRK